MSVTTLNIPRHNAQTLLEFESPTASVIARPIPAGGRLTIWVIAGTLLSSIAVSALYPVDKVVTVRGKVVAETPNLVIQPLDTSIVRQIAVHEGQVVHAGDRLAMLDPTFAASDATASEAQAASLQAEVDRLQAEADGRLYLSDGTQAGQLQAMIHAQRHAEVQARLESYRQRIESLRAKVAQATSDIASYAEQFRVAQAKDDIRRQLEHLQVGSRLSTLDADAQRAEVNRALAASVAARTGATSDLDGQIAERDAYLRQFRTQVGQELTDAGRKLSDARDQASKSALRRRLVDLRADRDAVVLNVAKVSVGSVVQSGDELVTLVPTDASLVVEASIPAREAGYVHSANPAVIKFDTLPYTTHGYATGTLKTVSADSFDGAGRERPSRPAASQPPADPASAYYRATVSLDAMKLRNMPDGFHLMPGMPVTSDIKVGKRTILAYLLSQVIPALTEGMREP